MDTDRLPGQMKEMYDVSLISLTMPARIHEWLGWKLQLHLIGDSKGRVPGELVLGLDSNFISLLRGSKQKDCFLEKYSSWSKIMKLG